MKKLAGFLLILFLCVGTASAQFSGGIVYDPTNYADAVLRYNQLVQQLAQLQRTYTQVVNRRDANGAPRGFSFPGSSQTARSLP